MSRDLLRIVGAVTGVLTLLFTTLLCCVTAVPLSRMISAVVAPAPHSDAPLPQLPPAPLPSPGSAAALERLEGVAYRVGSEHPEAQPANRRIVHLDTSRPFTSQMQEHLAQARALGLRPYLYATATWCPPCIALARYRDDPLMVEAYAGTYIIEVDIDVVPYGDLRAAGFRVVGVPAFYGIDDRGRHDGRTITGAAWGEDIPANMAWPLRRFFANESIGAASLR